MHTREGALAHGTAPRVPRAARLVDGMGRAAVTALAALAGCLLLITIGAAMSMCWALHPLLPLVAGAAVVWLVVRLASWVFRSGGTPPS